MSIGHITLNPEDIRSNPMNNSTAKMLYSFPKDKRFPDEKRIDVPFYDLPAIKNKRSTSLGFGHKVCFEDRRKVPPPNTYALRGDFEGSKRHGFSFGVSRENAKAVSVSIFTESDVPGPGTYTPIHTETSHSAAIKSRTKDHSLDERIKVPGPGQYDTDFTHKSGKITNSKYQNVRCPVICKSVSQHRKTQENCKSPAPWSYNPVIITCRGQKQLKEGKAARFSVSRRLGIISSNSNPGPGQYNHFSQFSR